MQLLLQFYSDSFETFQVFRSWSEDVHIVWIYSSDYFLLLFSQIEFSRFLGVYYYQDMNVLRIKFSD